MPNQIPSITAPSSGKMIAFESNDHEQHMSVLQIELLKGMILNISTIKSQDHSLIWSDMLHTLGLESNEQLLTAHFSDAEKYLIQRFYSSLRTMAINQIIAVINKLTHSGNNREIIANFITKYFGVRELWQLRPDLLMGILQILINHGNSDNLKSQLTGLKILSYLVRETALSTGLSCTQLWDKILTLSETKYCENIPDKHINSLAIWLAAKRRLSTTTHLTLDTIHDACQIPLEPTEFMMLRGYLQFHFQLTPEMSLTYEQAESILDKWISERMSSTSHPDMRYILPLYNQLSLSVLKRLRILSARPGFILLFMLIIILLINIVF